MQPQVACDPVLSSWFNDIHNKDKNKLIFVCGETGNCKSGSALRLAWDFDRDRNNKPRFYFSADPSDPKNRVVTSAAAFINLIKSNLPKGSCVVWDEIGVDADNREYYSLKNRLIKKVFQTFRSKNLVVLMTVPDFNSVDIGVRKLAHGYLEMHGQVDGGSYAKGIFQWLQTNPKTGKIYYKYPRYLGEFGCKYRIKKYYIKRPPAMLEEIYKDLKEKVNQAWYDDYKNQLDYMAEFTGDKLKDRNMSLPDLEEKVKELGVGLFFDFKKAKFVDVLLEAKLDIPSTKAKALAKYLNVQVDLDKIKPSS